MEKKYYDTFYGNKVSEYGLAHGYVDYHCLAESFDAVLNNDIISKTVTMGKVYTIGRTHSMGYWEQINGFVDNSEEIEVLREDIERYEGEIEKVIERDVDYEENHVYTAMNENIQRAEEKIKELEEDEQYPPDIYQYYIISESGAKILEHHTNEIVFYNDELNMYVWGVTHWGTSWDYVLTDIPLKEMET